MGSSSGRARRRRKAQELSEREASHFQQVKRQNVDSEIEEEEGDHEVLFPPKTQESVATPPSPKRVLEVPDCGMGSVTSMVRTLNDAIAAVSQDTAQIQQAYQQLRKDNLARDKALADVICHGEGIWCISGSRMAIRPTNSKNADGCPG